jgi:predicted transcriptional regulator of viral defense system
MATSHTAQVKKDASTGYGRPEGVRLLDALLVQGRRIFTTHDARAAAEQLGIPSGTTSWLLHELARSGWVRRLRRGLYAVDETHRGGSAPHPFAIATVLVEPSAISHWSALAHHGLTEQIPLIVTASTTRDVVTPRMRGVTSQSDEPASTWEVDGLAIRYIRVQPDRFWGFDDVWVDELSRVRITDRERTVLDAFVSPGFFGSIGEVLGILEEHLSELDVERLVSYALRYGQDAAIKRLGYALEQLGADPEAICPLRDVPVRGYRLLDPQGPDRGPYVAAWRLRDNLKAE